MQPSLARIALCTGLLIMGGCDNRTTPPIPPTPPMVNPPVPTAVPALPAVDPAPTDPAKRPTDGTRAPTQSSETLPMPGQNNDHSAPLTPAK